MIFHVSYGFLWVAGQTFHTGPYSPQAFEASVTEVWIQTIFASGSASSLRIALMPLDAVKTVLQDPGNS